MQHKINYINFCKLEILKEKKKSARYIEIFWFKREKGTYRELNNLRERWIYLAWFADSRFDWETA